MLLQIGRELETKRTFIRFISHEVRTPMNIALLGIDFLENLIHEICSDSAVKDILFTLTDVKTACKSAVDILDDALSFDKLSSGTLNLEQALHSPRILIGNVYDAFKMMVRE